MRQSIPVLSFISPYHIIPQDYSSMKNLHEQHTNKTFLNFHQLCCEYSTSLPPAFGTIISNNSALTFQCTSRIASENNLSAYHPLAHALKAIGFDMWKSAEIFKSFFMHTHTHQQKKTIVRKSMCKGRMKRYMNYEVEIYRYLAYAILQNYLILCHNFNQRVYFYMTFD